jgi:RimJ/RimL family protein N-acetyltransferase
MPIEPITLEGTHVRLEPLSLNHLEGLCLVGLDAELWRWTTTFLSTRDDMLNYIQSALRSRDEGTALPFVTILKEGNQVVGCTRYGNVDMENRRVEIGWTWIGRPWQRTVVNTEAKYLLLRHAFESLGCIRVEFKTDSLNEQSRRALQRIGAREEGILRNHMIVYDGRYRHSVFFSVIAEEWPTVKKKLEERL